MSENSVNGPEDSIETEMIKQLPQEDIHEITRCFQDGAGRCLKFVEDCEACVLVETRCGTEERDHKLQGRCTDVLDVEVVCDMCNSC